MDRAEHRVDRLRLTVGLEYLCLLLPFRPQDRALLLSLRGQDLRLLHALGGEDGRALVAVGAHLLLHRLANRARRLDRLQLDAVDADSPLAGRLVEDVPELCVDVVARRQRLLERHRTDHVAERRHRELLDCPDVVGDLVGRSLRIGDLGVDDPPRRFHLAPVGVHALEHHGAGPDERSRAGAQGGGRAQVPPCDRPDEQHARKGSADEDDELPDDPDPGEREDAREHGREGDRAEEEREREHLSYRKRDGDEDQITHSGTNRS